MQPDESPLTPKELVYQAFLLSWIKKAWEARSSVSVADFFHPDCVVTGMSPAILEGPKQIEAVYQSLHARVEHTNAHVSFVLIRGNCFSIIMELQGVHRDSGHDIVIEVNASGRLKDDLIHQCHNVVDYTSMYAKLGILDVDKLRAEFG